MTALPESVARELDYPFDTPDIVAAYKRGKITAQDCIDALAWVAAEQRASLRSRAIKAENEVERLYAATDNDRARMDAAGLTLPDWYLPAVKRTLIDDIKLVLRRVRIRWA